MLKSYLSDKNISIRKLSKDTGIAYSTMYDIVMQKTPIEKCESRHLYSIAKCLSLTMEQIYEMGRKYSHQEFELFKSEECHKMKTYGSKKYLIRLLQSNEITDNWEIGRKEQSLYLLSMADYLSRIYGVARCNKFSHLRDKKMDPIIYPLSMMIRRDVSGYEPDLSHAIPEFLEHGIVEGEIFNVW